MTSSFGSRLSRREVLRRTNAAALGLGLGAAAPVSARPASARSTGRAQGNPLKIQVYALVWQPGAIDAMHKAVDDWNAANGDRIEVEYVQGDWANARDFLTTSIAGGVAPDIIQGITAWANQYGQQGSYLDLTPLINGSDLATDLHPTALAAATSPIDGKTYAVPFCWEAGMMFVNADRFGEQGIAVPEQGWTWEEFLATAQKVSNPPDYYGMAANLGASQTTEDIIAWMWQTGAEVMGEKDGTWQIDIEPAREALTFWHDMVYRYEIISPDSFGGAMGALEAFPLGVYSMFQTGCFARGTILATEIPFAWRMVPLPHRVRRSNSSEPQTWSIAAATEERGTTEAAWEVVQWLSNKENSSALAVGDWLFPTRQSALSDPRFTTEEHDWHLALDQLQYGHPYPAHPAWAEMDERVLGPNIQKFLQNEMSLDQLIEIANTEGAALLTKYQTGG